MALKQWALLCLGFLAILDNALGVCPDYDMTGCQLWSDAATWSSGTPPGQDEDVTIDKCIIADVHTDSLGAVDITAQGRLIFSPQPEADVTLTARNIRVTGELRIGSSMCRYEGRAHIVLTESPDSGEDPDFGRKFIGVTPGGTLELHGAKKTPWGKINATLPKLTNVTGLHFDSRTKSYNTWAPGFLVYVINPMDGQVIYDGIFYIGGDSESLFNKDSERLILLLNWIPEGHIVAMVSNREAISTSFNMTPIYEAVEKAFYCKKGHSRLRFMGTGQAWAGVAVRERPQRTIEHVGRTFDGDDFKTAMVELKMPQNDLIVRVLSKRHKDQPWRDVHKIQGATYDGGVPVVTMADDVSSWRPGDRVLITSTDYIWTQAEEATVEKCDVHHRNITCSSNQVRLNYDRIYEHWGEITHRVDMRAEVALLSRNVKVSGLMPGPKEGTEKDRRFGGQIKVKPQFSNVHIQGVQLSQMGQTDHADAYPIFFDMCKNVSGEGYTNPAYVRENAILDSFRGCVVLRGTHEMLIQSNVAYKHAGSCFYLLEGGEKNNVIEGNLGLGTRKLPNNPTLMQFEIRLVATFFITNPLTYFRNNVAAGGDVRGIQYAFPIVPLRTSKGENFMQSGEAEHTAMLEFVNNTAHSNGEIGLEMQYRIDEDTTHKNSKYEPKKVPLDEESEDQEVIIQRLTSYKNRYENVNARGGLYIFNQCSISDSSGGMLLSTASDQRQYVTKTVILGESANIGEPTIYYYFENGTWQADHLPRAIPLYWEPTRPIQGVSFIDGPAFIHEVWFNDFINHTHYYKSGALGFMPHNRWYTSPLTSVEKISWGFDDGPLTGNRAYDGMPGTDGFGDETGDRQALFRDLDGSVTGVENSVVIKPYPMLTTDACEVRENWDLAVCPHRYGKINVRSRTWEDRQVITQLMTRDDVVDAPLGQSWKTTANFPVILGGDYSYITFFNSTMPTGFFLTAEGVERDQWVRVGVCVPLGAELELWSYMPDWRPTIDTWTEKASIEELDAADVFSSYYWDKQVGVIFFKFQSNDILEENFPYEFGRCPGRGCPFVRLTIANPDDVDMTSPDCRARAYGPYVRSAPNNLAQINLPKTLPATSAQPPQDYGAGDIMPAGLAVIESEGYSPWSSWAECSAQCGGGMQTRGRECLDQSGCAGPSVESARCNKESCLETPSNETSQWSEWSDCSVTCGGGSQTRERECQIDVCTDPTSESQECNSEGCPVDGQWGTWANWGQCSVTCEGGVRIRTRKCDDPSPQGDGAECDGVDDQLESCNDHECPIDGGLSSWSYWSTCTTTCGGGSQRRIRLCDSPEPEHGGSDCVGDLEQEQACNEDECPDDVCETDPPPAVAMDAKQNNENKLDEGSQ